MTINEKLEELIDEVIIMLNEPLLDDMYPDTLEDFDNRIEAIEYLEDKLLKIKEG